MYRLNPLYRNVLITTDEVIFHAPTKHTLDERMILNSIIIAEERFIRPILGTGFYNLLAKTKNLLITDANKAAEQIKVTDTGSNYTLQTGDIVNAWEYMSADNILFWKHILWKTVAECVMMLAVPEGFVQFGSEGVHHNQPTSTAMSAAGVVTPGLQSVKWAMDKKLQDRIDPLIEAVKNYLCENTSTFGSWDASGCPGCADDRNGQSRKTAWITSIYDDNNTDCGCP